MASAKNDKNLNKIIEVLKKEFKPSRLFLFGSRANGKPHKDSDYDFVVVAKGNKKSRLNNMQKARDTIWNTCKVSADVFVYSQKEFDEWKDELNSIPETALHTGKEIDLG